MRGGAEIVAFRRMPPAQAESIGPRRHRHRLDAFVGAEGAALSRQDRRDIPLQRHFDGGRLDPYLQGTGSGCRESAAENERQEHGWQAEAPNATYVTRLVRVCIDGGADAPVRGRPPGRPIAGAKDLIRRAKSGTRASRADQGGRPTGSAEFPHLGQSKWHWAEAPAPQGLCPHNWPFHCASRMRPATGAASAPPDRACSITVTTAPSVKPANHARYAPAGVRTEIGR